MSSRTSSRGGTGLPCFCIAGVSTVAVVAVDVVPVDEDAGTQTLVYVGQHQELPGDKLAQALEVEPHSFSAFWNEASSLKPERMAATWLLDLLHRHLLETEAVDLVEAQPLLDQRVEHPAADTLRRSRRPPAAQAELDRPARHPRPG